MCLYSPISPTETIFSPLQSIIKAILKCTFIFLDIWRGNSILHFTLVLFLVLSVSQHSGALLLCLPSNCDFAFNSLTFYLVGCGQVKHWSFLACWNYWQEDVKRGGPGEVLGAIPFNHAMVYVILVREPCTAPQEGAGFKGILASFAQMRREYNTSLKSL